MDDMSERLIIGMDFGTTNSGMAVWDSTADDVRLLPLDPANRNPNVARTAIYLTNDQRIHIGRAAVEAYMDENTGRPVRMEKVWVGEIEVRAEDMYYVTDVYVFADALSPGRLFLSIKSALREPDYYGTVVGQFYYPLEDLIALYLTVTRTRAEEQLGRPVRDVVLGRPVRFAFEPERDELAQNRLLDAALRAGYETVYFQYEPIAAAYEYAARLDTAENLLVFDFGGGTLDVTIMRIGGGEHKILATGGIPVAGDVFDQKLTRAKMPAHFGEGSKYRTAHKAMPIPAWIYDIFSDWQRILELQAPENLKILEDIAEKAYRPREIQALLSLVGQNYGLQMFDSVEQAKRRLSDDMGTLIRFAGPDFNVRQMVTRTEFEILIREEVQAVEAHLHEMLDRAGLTADRINAVARTGGSAQIPVFRRLLEDLFGRDTVRSVDVFSSVTAGLGRIAHEVAQGKSDLRAYTAADLRPYAREKTVHVGQSNLSLLQKRIRMAEQGDPADLPDTAVVIVGGGNRLITLPGRALDAEESIALPHPLPAKEWPWATAVRADYESRLLLLTNQYRFLLMTPRQLAELDELQIALADLHQFGTREWVTAVADWDGMRGHEWLTMVTSRGFARSMRMGQVAERVESPGVYRFDHALPGVPAAVCGTAVTDELILVNDGGRAHRFGLNNGRLRVRGTQAMGWRDGERPAAAAVRGEEPEWALITGSGHGRLVAVDALPKADKHNERPGVQVARKPTRAAFPHRGDRPWAITTTHLRPVPTERLPAPAPSTKTYKALTLNKGEQVLGGLG